jgi:hypothetical protein
VRHVACMGKIRNACTVLVENHEGDLGIDGSVMS